MTKAQDLKLQTESRHDVISLMGKYDHRLENIIADNLRMRTRIEQLLEDSKRVHKATEKSMKQLREDLLAALCSDYCVNPKNIRQIMERHIKQNSL